MYNSNIGKRYEGLSKCCAVGVPSYTVKDLTLDLNYLIDNNWVQNDYLTTRSLHFSIMHGSFKSFIQCRTCKYVRIRSVKFNPDIEARSLSQIPDAMIVITSEYGCHGTVLSCDGDKYRQLLNYHVCSLTSTLI